MQGDLLQQVQVGSTVPKSFSSEFNVPEEASILLRASNGAVKAVPSRSGRLEVMVRVAGHISQAGTKRLTTTLRPSDPFMILETDYEDTGIRASADYVIGLPNRKGIGFTLELLNGSLSAESLCCGLDVSISNGDLEAEDFAGQLRARLINGSLSVTGKPVVSSVRAGGTVDLDIGSLSTGGASVISLSGDVRIRLCKDLKLHLAAAAGDGTVSISGLSPKNVMAFGNRFEGDIGKGGPRLAVSSICGDISVEAREG